MFSTQLLAHLHFSQSFAGVTFYKNTLFNDGSQHLLAARNTSVSGQEKILFL